MSPTESITNVRDLRDRAFRQTHSGQLEAAQESLQLLVQQVPQDVGAWLKLSEVMTRRDNWADASWPLLQAAKHLPRHVPSILALIQELIAHGEIVVARQCLDLLAQAPNPPADLLKSCSGLRYLLGEYRLAGQLLDKALAAGVDDPVSHFRQGMFRYFFGDVDGASHALRECLRRWPQYGDAAVLLAGLERQQPGTDLLEHVDAQLSRIGANETDHEHRFLRAEFEYARFKILDDLDRRDEAWSSLAASNRRMHALYPYDAAGAEELVNALIRMELSPTDAHDSAPPLEGPMPIFVVGVPRSGTTLLERILSSHSRVASAGELTDFQRQLRKLANIPPNRRNGLAQAIEQVGGIDLRNLGVRYLKQTQWRAAGRDFYVDKLPANILMVALIRRALPQAPIVHVARDPMDTCFSNLRAMFGNRATFSYEMQAMAHHYRQYSRLVEHWRRRLPDAMADVSYVDLVDNTDATVRRVLAHCGLDMEDACLRPEENAQPVATPSSAQVREPVHGRAIGQWRRYETQLQPLREALGELAAESARGAGR